MQCLIQFVGANTFDDVIASRFYRFTAQAIGDHEAYLAETSQRALLHCLRTMESYRDMVFRNKKENDNTFEKIPLVIQSRSTRRIQ